MKQRREAEVKALLEKVSKVYLTRVCFKAFFIYSIVFLPDTLRDDFAKPIRYFGRPCSYLQREN